MVFNLRDVFWIIIYLVLDLYNISEFSVFENFLLSPPTYNFFSPHLKIDS